LFRKSFRRIKFSNIILWTSTRLNYF
jgi:hypothetical protein